MTELVLYSLAHTMNHLALGTADKTEQLLAWTTKRPFLLIDDGPIADVFVERFHAKLFDVTKHSFNPLRRIDYRRARDIAATIYAASPEGKETLTVRNGKRSLTRLLLNTTRLDRVKSEEERDQEAIQTLDDLLLSPTLKRVLCSPPNFSFKGQVVARLDRSVMGDVDAFLLAALLIGQTQGQVIVPDGGFYLRDMHRQLIRQGRLTAGVSFLGEIKSAELRNALLLVEDKVGQHCLPEDAEVLASFAGLRPGDVGHTTFVQGLVS